MAKHNKKESTKEQGNKNWITSGFTILLGIFLILVSMFLDINIIPSSINISEIIFTIISKALFSAGISLVVGFTTSKIRVFEEKQKEEQQTKAMENIIVSKQFLQTLSDDAKRDVIAKLLIPENNTLNKHSNIKEYLDTKSDKYLSFFNINFRTNFILRITVSKDDKLGKLIAKYKMSYRIYKINERFEPLCISFEKETRVLSTEIKYENKTIISVKKDDYILEDGVYKYNIPEEFQNYNFLVVERTIVEYGHKHWISLNWKSFTPIEGINYCINCSTGIIKEYYIFDDTNLYEEPDLSEDRKTLIIKSSKWLDPCTGLNAIVANPLAEDDFNDNVTNVIIS